MAGISPKPNPLTPSRSSIPFRKPDIPSCVVLFLVLGGVVCQAAEPGGQSRDEAGERQAIHEANRVLQEEIKLAARPQTYVVVDVHQGVIIIKARGVELYRFPILSWHGSGNQPPVGLFRLTERPPVSRPQAKPGDDAMETPIELQDMPAEYLLAYEPPLMILIAPPARDHPWLWIRSLLREWWARTLSRARAVWSPDQPRGGFRLRLTLSRETAQSLAWSVTDGMPFLIGRTAIP